MLALVFANVSVSSLFLDAARKRRTWRSRGIELAGGLAFEIIRRNYARDLSIDWDRVGYVACVALVLYFVWQVLDRLVLRPNAFERRKRESPGWYREEFPRL